METLINTHAAGFAQGSTGCHGQAACTHAPTTAGLPVTWWAPRGPAPALPRPATPHPAPASGYGVPRTPTPRRLPRPGRHSSGDGGALLGATGAWAHGGPGLLPTCVGCPHAADGADVDPRPAWGETSQCGCGHPRLLGEGGPGPPRAHGPSRCGQACPSCPVCQHHGGAGAWVSPRSGLGGCRLPWGGGSGSGALGVGFWGAGQRAA